jgi:hypothetical protein
LEQRFLSKTRAGPVGRRDVAPSLQGAQVDADQFGKLTLADVCGLADDATIRCSYLFFKICDSFPVLASEARQSMVAPYHSRSLALSNWVSKSRCGTTAIGQQAADQIAHPDNVGKRPLPPTNG